MPLVLPEGRKAARISALPSIIPDPIETPTAGEQIGAGFELENPLTGLSDTAVAGGLAGTVAAEMAARRARPEPEEGFDPYEHLLPGEEIVASRFADVTSRRGMERRREEIIRENELKRDLATGPLNPIIAALPAVVADPTNYIPMLGQVRGASLAVRAGRLAFTSAGQAAASETILHATQRTRSAEQSVAAIILSGGFGATVGGAAGVLANRAARRAATADVQLMLEAGRTNPFPEGSTLGSLWADSTAGAARYQPIRPEDTLPAASGRVGELLSRFPTWLRAPSVDMLYSRFPFARELAIRLTDTGILNEGVLRDTANPAALSVRIKTYDRFHHIVDQTLKQTFREHTGGLSRTDFRLAIGRAMRRGDVSPDPAITKAAKVLRRDVVEPLAAEAQRLGLLPKDLNPHTAVSYFSRVYNVTALKANQGEFERIVAKWFERTHGVDADEALIMARDVWNSILGGPGGRTALGIPVGKRGPLAERTFFIPDEEIEPFLISDPLEVMPRFVNTMARDLEFSKTFGDLGGGLFPIEAIQKRLRDEASELAAQLPSEAARRKVIDEAERLLGVIEGLMHRLRGTYGDGALDPAHSAVAQGLAVARNWNFMRLLGAVTLSSVPDLGMQIAREGFGRVLTRFVPAFVAGMRQTGIGRREANLAGAAIEFGMATSRANAIGDLGERTIGATRMERALNFSQDASRIFALGIGVSWWNATMKSAVGAIVSTRILQSAQKVAAGGKLTGRDARAARLAGLNDDMLRRIAAEQPNYIKHNGLVFAGIENWTDREAANAFRAALVRDVDDTVLTPGPQDAPLWTSTEFGKTANQFRRFVMTANQRILLRSGQGLMNGDAANTLIALTTMVSLGMGVRALKDMGQHGLSPEVWKERTPEKWIADAVDQSGVLGMFVELDQSLARFHIPTPFTLLAGRPTRFQEREIVSQLGGPMLGLFEDVHSATTNALAGEFTQRDLHKIRRIFPAQNVPVLGKLLTDLEESSGLPEK